jgi:hypothetical protein
MAAIEKLTSARSAENIAFRLPAGEEVIVDGDGWQ